jgi:predicted Zn-dependent peptidase
MYERTVLDNGLRVLVTPMPHMHSVSVAFFIGVGSRYEAEADSGAAHFIEHMLFKGTAKYPNPRELAEAIEGIGGSFNAGTGQEATLYWAKVAQPHLSVALDLLLDMLLRPRFLQVDVERERQVIIEEIALSLDMPDQWVSLLLLELIWPHHPLGRAVAGTRDSVASLQRERLLEIMVHHYSPANIVLAVAGNLDPDALLALVEEGTRDWAPREAPTYPLATDAQTAPQVVLGRRETEQAHLCLSAPGLPRDHPDRYALMVMNAVLGEGMSSRLFQEIRERLGLAYEVSSSVVSMQDTGAMVAYAGVEPGRAPLALQAILAEWDRVRQTLIPAEELHKAKELIKGQTALRMENTFSVAAWAGQQELLRGRILSVDEFMEAIDAVEPADVQRLARQLFQTEKLNCAVVGPFTDEEVFQEMIHL